MRARSAARDSRTGADTPSITIFGAGAIGCWIGGQLAAGGAHVTLIGRPRVLDEIAAHGLTVSELDGEQLVVRGARTHEATDERPDTHGDATPVAQTVAQPDAPRVRLATEPSAAAGAALVLVTVKSAQTAEAGAALARVLPSHAVVASLQNGVRNTDVLRAALPGRTVLAGMVPWNVVRRGPGAYHRASSGTLMVEHHARGAALYDALRAAGLDFATRTDMPAVLWAKLVMNLNNAINALSGQPLATELGDRSFRRCLAACQREALELLALARIPVARLTLVPPRWMPRLLELPDPVFRVAARRTISIDPHARSSMADDLAVNRPTEIDYLQGEIVALAERLGRTAPANAALVRMIRAAEAGDARRFSGAELAAALGI
jgi:2-dehydropantoate 2-reductase